MKREDMIIIMLDSMGESNRGINILGENLPSGTYFM